MIFSKKQLQYIFQAWLLLLFFITFSTAYAACSPYIGQASLNEFFKERSNQAADNDDFVEVRILDTTITSSIFNNWTIKVCENNTGNNNSDDGCGTFSLSDFDQINFPWVSFKGQDIGQYINMKENFDAALIDAAGNLIDYFSLNGFTDTSNSALLASCPVSNLAYDYNYASTGTSAKSLWRSPDGIGNWDKTTSGADDGTEEDTNDIAPDGGTPPTVTVENVIVNKGTTATFIFALEKAVPYDVEILYTTEGGTAVPDTDPAVTYDYIYNAGVIKFAANTTTLTQTVDVPTNSINPSTANTVFFYLKISNQLNARIVNGFPTGTILGSTTAEWHFDETSWDGTTGEVIDSSLNTNNGTTHNNLTNTATEKVLCKSGQFDGADDYISFPHHSSLLGDTQLTYSVWVKPDSWSASGINQVMAKSVHGGGSGRAQMGIFSENGELVGRAETANGIPHNVYTSLPSINAWTHITLVFNGNSLKIYKNGVIADNISASKTSSVVFTSTTLVQNNDPLMLSKRVDTDAYYFDGYIDEVLVMQSSIPASLVKSIYDNYLNGSNWNGATRSCSAGLHHFEIRHDGVGLTCEPENIYVKACADSACSTLYPSDITVTPSPVATGSTSWSPNPQVISSGAEATLQLSHKTLSPSGATSQTLTLGISSSSTVPTDSNVICKDLAGNISACNIAFYDSGFIYTIPTQISCVTSATPIKITAVRKDLTSQQCVSLFTGPVTKTIDFTINAAPNPDIIINKGLSNETIFTALAATQPVDLLFNNSEATFTLTHDNAGQFTLNASHVNAGLTLLGSSSFVVRPHSYFLEAAYDNSGTEITLNNSSPSGDPKWKASDNFRLRLRGQCQNGTVTTNYAPTNAELQVELNLPTAGVNSNLALQGSNYLSSSAATPTWHNISTKFDTGAVTDGTNNFANAVFHEVGILKLHVRDTDYYGATIPEQTQIVGRFTPHHFDTTVNKGCDTFTYSGQPFTVNATARNNAATPATTQNYTAAFAKDTTVSNAGDTSNFGTTNIITASSFLNGIASKTDIIYTFPSKDTIPDTITLRANDTDTSPAIGITEDTTEIRSGRARLENVFGSELTPLSMPLSIEFYSDNTLIGDTSDDGFILNTDDTCSSYDATLGALTNYTANLQAGETTVTGAGAISAGQANITFSAPGAGNEGSVNLLANTISDWLTYSWNVDCDNADGDNDITTGIDAGLCGPSGVASFGLYRGDDRVIYWREVF